MYLLNTTYSPCLLINIIYTSLEDTLIINTDTKVELLLVRIDETCASIIKNLLKQTKHNKIKYIRITFLQAAFSAVSDDKTHSLVVCKFYMINVKENAIYYVKQYHGKLHSHHNKHISHYTNNTYNYMYVPWILLAMNTPE